MARRLLFLNGLATVGLVLNHASSWVFTAMFFWTHRYRDVAVPNFDALGGATYYALRVIEQLVAFTVPAFLFVSGFFVAFAAGQEPPSARWTTVTTRLQSLVIPYLLWSTLLLVAQYVEGRRQSPIVYLTIYLTGKAAAPYYFIPLLSQYLLLAPLLISVAKVHWAVLLSVTGLVQLAVLALRYPMMLEVPAPALQFLLALTPNWLFISKIFWFSFGLVAGLHPDIIQRRLARSRWVVVAGAMVLLVAGILEWELIMRWSPSPWTAYIDTAVDGLYAVLVVLMVVAFAPPRTALVARIEELGRYSYGVYLVHALVLAYAARAIYHLVPSILAHGLLFMALLTIVGLAAPLAAMTAMRRSRLSGAYRYVFG